MTPLIRPIVAALAFAFAAGHAYSADTPKIRIGLLTDTQATYARIGGGPEVAWSARAAVQDYKAQGGKLEVELFNATEGTSPTQTYANAKDLVKRNHVTMITGLVGSGSATAAFKAGKEDKVLTIVSSGSSAGLINDSCTPYSVQWMQNTYNLAAGVIPPVVASGKKKWFIVYADYAFGTSLRDEAKKLIEAGGGTVVGVGRHNFPEINFTEVINQAQNADADVVAVASAGSDMVGFLTEAKKAGLATEAKTVVPLSLFMQDITDLGLDTAGGLTIYGSWFYSQDADTMKFAQRFMGANYRMPDMAHATVYSSVYQYLKAIDAVGSEDPDKVMAYLKSITINDLVMKNGHIRADGSMIHDGYVVKIKTPAEAAHDWDYYQKVTPVKGESIAFPIERSTCANVVKPAQPKVAAAK